MKYSQMFAPGLFVVLGFVSNAGALEPTNDSLDTVKMNLASRKAVLLDVREKDEWNDGHLKDAIHLPLSAINKGISAEKLAKITDKDSIIYLHCAAGARSLEAANRLAKTGRDLRSLEPGFDALVKAGFPKAKR